METNNIDKIVSDSLESRTIKPSNSSWERLSNQLDIAQEKKRKNWFLYVGYAASVLLVVSVAFFMNTNNGIETIIPEKIVTSPIIDTTKFVKPTLNNTIPTETVIVKNDKAEDDKSQKNTILKKKKPQIKHAKIIEKNPIVIAENITDIKKETKNPLQQNRIIIDSNLLLKSVDQTETKVAETKVNIPKKGKKYFQKSSIKINSDALLYATLNPDKDINDYYKKYNIDRNDVLKKIQKEINKTNLKIDAATLLTSVEKTIDEDTFKKSFMQVVKGKITGLATAIANRNN
tara:strand:+ start:6164 stop:7030 length:867 start_codon:yes stop_codon:yes gene_type:complete